MLLLALVIGVLMISWSALTLGVHAMIQPVPSCPTVGTPLYLSDIMEHMTEPEADALIRAVQAARG